MHNFRRLLQSATVKLTAGFLTGIMLVTIIFSLFIYKTTSSELDSRFEIVRTRLEKNLTTLPSDFDLNQVQLHQIEKSHRNIVIMLVYANLVVLTVGGVASYLLARRVLEPIEEIHEAQSRFTSDASHELRTPLAVMKAEMEVVLRDKQASKADYGEVITSSLEEVNRLDKLSTTLLQLARLEDIALSDHVNLTKATEYALKRHNIPDHRYQLTAPKKPLVVQGNRESIIELLMILLDNALKYSPDDSKIIIHLSRRTTRAGFSIENDGEGISPENLRRIFQRFYRVDSARTRQKANGYGLGLALAKRIVEVHGGELTASSAKNQRTKLAVRLPIKR